MFQRVGILGELLSLIVSLCSSDGVSTWLPTRLLDIDIPGRADEWGWRIAVSGLPSMSAGATFSVADHGTRPIADSLPGTPTSSMTALSLDTHALVRRLKATGLSEDQAEAITTAIRKSRDADLTSLVNPGPIPRTI